MPKRAREDIKRGFTGKCCPELYTKWPSQPEKRKPGQLSPELIKQYFEEGYLVIDDYFKKEELEPCREAIEKWVEEVAQKLYKGGKIKDLYKEYGLFERLTKIEADFPGANIVMHKMGAMPKEFQDLWSNERLLNLVEQLIGPDIMGHPVWNLRTKTPNNEATVVPWHQDSGYLDVDSYDVLTPTAWIPFLDTNEENGCMQVAKNGHKKGLIATHECCHGGTWYIMLDEKEMEKTLDVDLEKDVKTCPIPYGGMLLINNHIPHQSLPNRSKKIRWTVDLRWQNSSKPVGFYGLKEGVIMRTSKDPKPKIDWDTFNEVNRNIVQRESVEDMVPDLEDEFDTTITGPWMKKWKITHVNRHTRELGNKEMKHKA